jgi:hypothetical protein
MHQPEVVPHPVALFPFPVFAFCYFLFFQNELTRIYLACSATALADSTAIVFCLG